MVLLLLTVFGGMTMLDFENLNKGYFQGVGDFDIPQITPTYEQPDGEFIPANYAKTEKNRGNKIVHCFVDDYQIARFWNNPDSYIKILSQFKAVLSPDFSTYTDMPLAMQIYNHYRKHWVAKYWQTHGILVYPTISWGNEQSYDWCFCGEPVGGVVAVSSVGTQKNETGRRLFLRGYEEMMNRLKPSAVVFYGSVPKECFGNIINIRPHQESIRERVKNGRKR